MSTLTSSPSLLKRLPSHAWNRATAAHLLNRAGFGARPEEVEEFADLGLAKAVQRLVHPERIAYDISPPAWARTPSVAPATPSDTAPDEQARVRELRAWWLQRMIESPRPLEEKLTLFWHSHFATQASKVRSTRMVYQHNETLRRHAFDFLGVLTVAVARDPAMVRFLDLETSQKGRPNDNFARELMELYLLGEGHYSEKDVREAARAFTGWTLNGEKFQFNKELHDDGVKTFHGRSGTFDGVDIINILLEQDAAARFVPRKLFEFFVHPNPDASASEQLADRFHEVFFSIRDFLETLFTSELFYTQAAYRNRVKSPVEYVIGAVRQFHVRPVPYPILDIALRRMGQDLFEPPDVNGWVEGKTWINTHTLMVRYHFAHFITTGEIPDSLALPANGYGELADAGRQAPPIESQKLFEPPDYREPGYCIDQTTRRMFTYELPADQRQRWIRFLQTASNGARVDFNLANRVSIERMNSAIYILMCAPEYHVC